MKLFNLGQELRATFAKPQTQNLDNPDQKLGKRRGTIWRGCEREFVPAEKGCARRGWDRARAKLLVPKGAGHAPRRAGQGAPIRIIVRSSNPVVVEARANALNRDRHKCGWKYEGQLPS